MINLKKLQLDLFSPVDASSVAVFRIGFGIILLWDVWRYYANGWVERFYIEPDFYFKYYGFEWVQPWGSDGMYIHFVIMGLCAFLIIIGAFYRIAIVIFTLAFSYVFLLDQTRYLNHFYLVILFSILLCVIPAHRYFSLDALLIPKLQAQTVPRWSLWLLRAQMEIMLIFAGIVKINADWLQLEPLRMWLEERADFPFGFGYLFTQDWAVAVAAYGVIVLHIVGAPLLLYKRTRLTVFCIYAAFHSLNHFVFSIGIFPWFTLFASLLFFEPDWPKKVFARIKSFVRPAENSEQHSTATLAQYAIAGWQQNLTAAFITVWISTQILIPLRHFLYPGNVSWTEEGHRFAWQMKLRDKDGWVDFYVVDADNRADITHVPPESFVTRKQARKMAGRPDMILQFAHYLARHWKEHYGIANLEVRATAFVSLNGRKPVLLIDPDRDLARVKRNLWHASWILPLKQPLKIDIASN